MRINIKPNGKQKWSETAEKWHFGWLVTINEWRKSKRSVVLLHRQGSANSIKTGFYRFGDINKNWRGSNNTDN